MSGGKGGSQTSQVEIPQWIQQPSMRNMARAEALQKVGYMPYMGPDVAGLTSPQQQAMQANIDAASAFGLVDPGMSAMDGMPQTSQFGGVSGYSSYPMYQQAVDNYEATNPGQARQYNNLFVNPESGLGGSTGSGMMGGGVNSGGQNNPGGGGQTGDPGDVGQFTAFDPTKYSIMDGNPYGVDFIAQAPDMSDYMTAEDLNDRLMEMQIATYDDTQLRNDINSRFESFNPSDSMPDMSGYVTTNQLDNRFESFNPMSSMPDLSNYAQMSDLYDDSQLRTDMNNRFDTFSPGMMMPDLSNYVTTDQLNNRFDTFTPEMTMPDMSGYATTESVTNQFNNLPAYQAPDFSNYATKDYLTGLLANIGKSSAGFDSSLYSDPYLGQNNAVATQLKANKKKGAK